MNRVPPNLLYLTIYNPTLKPSGPIEGDNEDAEEQAHILFYTSRERAVSRDRMLRQIGLAKALISFAESFNSEAPCENVHSQSSRMIMVSPEPNYWIHAAVELAKIPRARENKDVKSKPKTKQGDKGKEKAAEPTYDYEDGSLHDSALRAHLLQGYERFKLTHGSFTSIMNNLGQQALELQLERFWTVWAWSWDLEKRLEFGEDLGPLLHPSFSSLIPIVDDFSNYLSTNTIPVVLSRKHIIPSARYTEGRYPTALAVHLSSMIPPVEPSRSSDTLDTLASSVDTIKGRRSSESKGTSKVDPPGGATFLGIPSINVSVDPKKWNWPGYLTFGKGNNVKAQMDRPPDSEPKTDSQDAISVNTERGRVEESSRLQVDVNTQDLEDAMTSDSLPTASNAPDDALTNADSSVVPGPSQEPSNSQQTDRNTADAHLDTDSVALSADLPNHEEDSRPFTPPPLPDFSMTNLNLAPFSSQTSTKRVAIHYMIRSEFMLALINSPSETGADTDDAADLEIATEKATKLLDDLESASQQSSLQSMADSLPSATKILQTQDRYLISTGQYTHGTPEFSSTSSHLFNAKAILDLDPALLEVFSRGQNPQHWHAVKKGLSTLPLSENGSTGGDGLAFMEVFRKEASLTDVDNVLAGVIRKSGLVDNGASSLPGSR